MAAYPENPEDIATELKQARSKAKSERVFSDSIAGKVHDKLKSYDRRAGVGEQADMAEITRDWLDRKYKTSRPSQTGGMVYEKPIKGGGREIMEVPFLKGDTPKEHYARHPERLEALLKQGGGRPMSALENVASMEAGKKDYRPEQEYGPKQFNAGRRKGPAGRGKLSLGTARLGSKIISSIARKSGPMSVTVIYGLAILNDVPDLASPIIEALTLGSGAIVNFLFDAIVFLGFRYFLSENINIPGVKVLLYSAAFIELLPIPIFSPDIFPFWTLCAWLVMKKIKKQQQIEKLQLQARQQQAQMRQAVPAWVQQMQGA